MPTHSFPYTGNDYLTAARARLTEADVLKENPRTMIMAMYCAGVAIECIFRAYIVLQDKTWDSRHNLEKLYQRSHLSSKLDEEERSVLLQFVKLASRIWTNDLRYVSEVRFKRIKAHEFVKNRYNPKDIGKYIGKTCDDLFRASSYIVDIGEKKW